MSPFFLDGNAKEADNSIVKNRSKKDREYG
jgi:hypothetical protein